VGSLKAMLARRGDLSPARRALIEAAREARIGLKELSIQVGRNPGYLQQFVVKQSPKHLPEQVRLAVAGILGVDEARLRDIQLPPLNAHASAHPHRPAIPRITDTDLRAETLGAADTITPPRPPPDAVAVLTSATYGLLPPRTLLICDRAPPAIGEYVLAADATTRAAGLLLPPTADGYPLFVGTGTVTLASDAQFWRIRTIHLP
jgi:hypothetical protein